MRIVARSVYGAKRRSVERGVGCALRGPVSTREPGKVGGWASQKSARGPAGARCGGAAAGLAVAAGVGDEVLLERAYVEGDFDVGEGGADGVDA